MVMGWLETHGFTVKNLAPSRNLITFSGTVAQAEVSFGTQIHQYRIGADTRISNATEIALPRGLANVVAGVGGLSGFRPKPQAVAKRLDPQFTSQFSGNYFLAPVDWATIYNVTSIYNAGYTGTGMHVGIAGQTYFPQEDIDDFRATAGLSTTKLNMVCISTTDCTDVAGESVGDVGEADLDVEWSGGIAQNATVDFVYAAADDPGQDVFSAAVYLVTTYKVDGAVVPAEPHPDSNQLPGDGFVCDQHQLDRWHAIGCFGERVFSQLRLHHDGKLHTDHHGHEECAQPIAAPSVEGRRAGDVLCGAARFSVCAAQKSVGGRATDGAGDLGGGRRACVGCSGSGGSSTSSPQTYTVTVTPTGSGIVINPAAISVTVTVQ
jgi:hypothetical protein